jgi:phosphoglycerate dehydrogenase-like enzyme
MVSFLTLGVADMTEEAFITFTVVATEEAQSVEEAVIACTMVAAKEAQSANKAVQQVESCRGKGGGEGSIPKGWLEVVQ